MSRRVIKIMFKYSARLTPRGTLRPMHEIDQRFDGRGMAVDAAGLLANDDLAKKREEPGLPLVAQAVRKDLVMSDCVTTPTG